MYSYTTRTSLGRYATFQAKKQEIVELKSKLKERSSQTILKPLLVPMQRHQVGYKAKLSVKRVLSNSEKLQNIVNKSHHTLFSSNTVFPFTLFPDSIHIDRQKLTIVHRNSFRMAKTISVSLNDIQNVQSNVGPLFGSLILTSKYFQNNTQSINFLWRKDVIKAQQLLQGYMVARHGGINFSTISTENLIALLVELGESDARKVKLTF